MKISVLQKFFCTGLLLASCCLQLPARASVAELYITEVMANPAAVSDTLGE